VPGAPELLAVDGVARPGAFQRAAHRLLHRPVGVGDRREVGFRLDLEVEGAEPPHRGVVGGICQNMREPQVIVKTRHDARRYREPGPQRRGGVALCVGDFRIRCVRGSGAAPCQLRRLASH
jgi:hypothetical protein